MGRALFLAQESRPNIMHAITILSDAPFGATNLDIQDAYLLMDLGSTLYIPVQEQEGSELDHHYNMPELLFGSQAKDLDSSSDDTSSDDSSSITSFSNSNLMADTS